MLVHGLFLDNPGDIILDAVLTDTGRFRMARGDFRISKFALGDDEIDYSLFNKNHPSGSAYYDLEILRTPLLEAFTNNTSTMKSKLLSITRTNILHLPVLKLLNGGNSGGNTENYSDVAKTKLNTNTGGFIVTCDEDTEVSTVLTALNENGIMKGSTQSALASGDNAFVSIERGLDTTEISPLVRMPATLQETQFIIEADYRLGFITDLMHNQYQYHSLMMIRLHLIMSAKVPLRVSLRLLFHKQMTLGQMRHLQEKSLYTILEVLVIVLCSLRFNQALTLLVQTFCLISWGRL